MDNLNVVIVGVGGQGTLLASRVLGHIAINIGLDVKVSEVHGMSQRGGSVITYVRMASKVYSALVEQKGADYVLALEQLEALRALPYLKDGGTILLNTQRILPMPVITGAASYPEDIVKTLQNRANTVAVDAFSLAEKSGNKKTVNTVLIGLLAKRLPYPKEIWIDAILNHVPKRFQETNIKAFEEGFAL